MYCPDCGKKTGGGFCKDCKPVEELKVRDIQVKVCATCGRYFAKKSWLRTRDLSAAVAKLAREHIKETGDIEVSVSLPEIPPGPGVQLKFGLVAARGGERFELPGTLLTTVCTECSRRKGTYLEGTLQLRNVSPEILQHVDAFLKRHGLFVSKETKRSDGVDLDLPDKRRLQQLGHELENEFGGLLKVSPRLFSYDRQKSKDIHRVNVYYEGPDYRKGDVISLDGKVYRVSALGKLAACVDLATGKKASLDLDRLDYDLLPVKKTTVSTVYPKVEVLDPDTWQAVPVRNPREGLKQGEKVLVADDEGVFYLVE